MSTRSGPPSSYVHRNGNAVHVDEPTWPWPRMEEREGVWWAEVPDLETEGWVHLGHAPAPRTNLGRFRHHLLLGLLSGYPLVDVFVYSFKHRREL